MILVDLVQKGKLDVRVIQESPNDLTRIQNLPAKELNLVNGIMVSWLVPYEDISLLVNDWKGEIILSKSAQALYDRYLWEMIPTAELESIPVEGQYFSREPKSHQLPYILASKLRNRSSDYGSMGCVDGEAIIHVNRATLGRKYTIAHAFYAFHGKKKPGARKGGWHKDIPTYVRSLCDGVLKQHKLLDIKYSGKKQTLVLTTKKGKSIKVTPEHEIAQPDGIWTQAQNLRAGDQILVNGKYVCRLCGTEKTNWREFIRSSKAFPEGAGTCRKCFQLYYSVRGEERKIDRDGYVTIRLPNHPRTQYGRVYEHILVMEKFLGRYISVDEKVHHKDHNKQNNVISNLEILTGSEHAKHHADVFRMHGGTSGTGGKIWFYPEIDEIESIVAGPVIDTYDLVMEDPHNNFVANGIVVHNSGKSLCALERARRFPFTRCLVVGPANVVSLKRKGWYDQIIGAYGEKPLMYRGTPAERAKMNILDYRFVLVSYNLVHELDPYQFDSYILDEVHLARSKETKRYQDLLPLLLASWRSADICFQALTGTPIGNHIHTAWALLHMVSPLLAGSFEAFCRTHEEVTKMGCRTTIVENPDGSVRSRKTYYTAESKLANAELFEQKMLATARRVSQDEVMKFKRSIRFVDGNLTDLQADLYDRCKLHLLDEEASKRLNLKHGKVQMLRLLQISEGPFNLREEFPELILESWKLDYAINAILTCGQKIAIWSRFAEGIEILHKLFPDRSVMWRGTVSKAGKDAAITAFSGDDGDPEVRADYYKYAKKHGWNFGPGEAQVFLGVMDLQSSLGINLQAARYQIFMSFSLSVTTNVQTASRLIRLDQAADEVISDILVSRNTWERPLYISLLNKWKESEQALYGKESVSKNEFYQFLKLLQGQGRREAPRGADRWYADGISF